MKSLLTLLILFSTSALFAQGWQWQNPRVFGNNFSCVGSLEDGAVWASSEDGDLVWSTDAGQSWIVRNMLGGPLNKTVFADPLHGWGLNGWQGYDDSAHAQILFTTDGGFSWTVQYNLPHTETAQLYDIEFLDSQHGWVLGTQYDGVTDSGLLLRTTNGGQAWSLVGLDAVASSISFIDTANGWLSADTLLWRTSDGGETWSRAPGNCPGAGLLRFVDSTHAWTTSGGVHLFCDVYYTTNAGQTWTPQGVRLDLNHFYQDLEFVDGNTVYAVSDNGWVCVTHNAGSHWSRQRPLDLASWSAVHPADAQHAWAVGQRGVILYTSDGGANWLLQSGSSSLNFGLSDVDFSDLRHGWAIGGNIGYTSDGGTTWTVQDTGNSEAYTASVDAVDSLSAWVCGYDRGLRHTTDGGASWFNVFPDPHVGLVVHAAHYGSSNVWVVGYSPWMGGDSAVCHSSDRGVTWRCVPLSDPAGYTYAMQFVSASKGWRACSSDEGGYGQILRTTDGGDSWELQYTYAPSGFASISFVDSLHGWAGGWDILLHTTDGGDRWDSIPAPPHFMSRVQFLDTLTGWGLSSWGQVYRTADGGFTWTDSRAGAAYLQAMDFVDVNHGWVAGASGSIMMFDGNASAAKPHAGLLPQRFTLSAYPNPFNPTTILSFDVPKSSRVTLSVYDLTGRLVQTLTDRVYLQGNFRINFDGSNLSSGIYFARLQGPSFSKTQKLVLLK